MQTRRIFWKIYPSYLIIILLSLAAVFLISSAAMTRFYHRQTAESLGLQAIFIEEKVRDAFQSSNKDELEHLAEMLGGRTPARVTLVLPDGTVAGVYELILSEHGDPECLVHLLTWDADSQVWRECVSSKR